MKTTQIDGQALMLEESTKREYKFILAYEKYVANNHAKSTIEIKEAVRKNNQVSQDESNSHTL